MELRERFEIAAFMREEYSDFRDFAMLGMAFLGFSLTDMQGAISNFMQHGPRLRMVMAQRGEAKSTLAALYAVWRLVQQPYTRILIVSGGEKQASEVAYLVIRLITNWEILEYLRPDKRAGDRTSNDEFDIHWALKGLDKSPSVACVGITANLQGKRADLLIPDDIETTKNGLTVTQRDQLRVLSREFSSICTHGDILYLGTPQSKDSIYNSLAQRGFTIRIWPGRYPSDEELEKYEDRIAPEILEALKADPTLRTGGGIDGKRGKPTDPDRFDEYALVEKELDQGPEGFQLQYMLDTSLMDAMRQQLKLGDLVIGNFDHERLPEVLVWSQAPQNIVVPPKDFALGTAAKMYHPIMMANTVFAPRGDTIMCIDPAGTGKGGDETGFAVTTSIGPYIHLLIAGGLRGGLSDENGKKLCDIVREFGVSVINIESNAGLGLVKSTLIGILADNKLPTVGVVENWATGQKERRIISSLVSSMQRHKLVVHQRVLDADVEYCKQHSIDKRMQFSLFYQMQNITTDRGSLPHDDRLDAVAAAVAWHKNALALSEHEAAQARAVQAGREFIENPMGYTDAEWQAMQGKKLRGTKRFIHARRTRK